VKDEEALGTDMAHHRQGMGWYRTDNAQSEAKEEEEAGENEESVQYESVIEGQEVVEVARDTDAMDTA
jgi:hypothetical protein